MKTVELITKSDPVQSGSTAGYPATYLNGDEYLPPWNRELLLRYSLGNTYHARAILVKTACIAGLGFSVEAESDQAANQLKAVMENTAEEFGFFEILGQIIADVEGCGMGFLELRRARGGEVGALGYVPAHTVYRRKDGRFAQHWATTFAKTLYDRFTGDRQEKFSLLEFSYPTSRLFPHYTVPEWLAAAGAMDMDRSVLEYNQAFFANHAMPRYGIVVEGDPLTPDQAATLKSFFLNEVKGSRNAHRAVLVQVNENTKVRFEPLTAAVQEASFLQLRSANRDEILSAHGIPPRIMGVVVSGALGGSGETAGQLQIFKQTNIRPKQMYVENRLNRAFQKLGFQAKIRLNELDVTTNSEDMEFWARGVESGLVTADTAQQALNLPQRSDVQKSIETTNRLLKIRQQLQELL